jgi:hypothetical protein
MLIREFDGKKTWEENPRVTIGLSPVMLDLDLSQMTSMTSADDGAHYVLRRVHPDVHSGVSTPAVTRFSDALTLLNDHELFDLDILDFREGHTPYRKEIQTLRIRMYSLEKEVKDLTTIVDSL